MPSLWRISCLMKSKSSHPSSNMPKRLQAVPPLTSDQNNPRASGATTLGFDLDSALEHIAHWLPSQSPIKDFIHHNTLHALQHRPFHEAVAIASRIYGAKSYLPLSDYQARYREGRIYDFALDRALASVEPVPSLREHLKEQLFRDDHKAHYPPLSLALHGLRQTWLTHIEVNLDAQVHPILFRLIANFLDQGISRWSVAREEESLWPCLSRLTENSFVPLYPFKDRQVRKILAMSPDEAILFCLQRIVGDETHFGVYLLELALGHPGWSGMVRVIERNPESLLTRRIISLKEFIAVELAMEMALLFSKRGPHFKALSEIPGIDEAPSFAESLDQSTTPQHLKIWHEAMEFSLHAELLTALQQQPHPTPTREIKVQALFCIDDRECSLRRHLEEISPAIETFGAAGFFGIEFFFKGIDDIYPVAQCPVVMTPKHLVIESESSPKIQPEIPSRPSLDPIKKSQLMRNWLFTQTLGLGYAAKLAWDVFRPGAQLIKIKKLAEVSHQTRLHLLRESDELNDEGQLLGFTHTEMADRLESLLKNIGLTHGFAPVVVVVAHGSSSTNNPHFAAYDCGACAGKPGAPNARAFTHMANIPEVRDLLQGRGIDIPQNTLFIPALHDTSRDEVTYYDQQDWPSERPDGLSHFQSVMTEALARNAHERCRWFELGPKSSSEAAAVDHVRIRASSIFEPRPELNHSNNLYCIVGPRSLTEALFLDRRAFLHSYDPTQDSEGVRLSRILSQVIPVCGGINLEYLFSRIDNSMYGAGTKLPHNVIGLLGVANGVEGDLRTGLPSQMIEVHEPSRLLIAVNQTTTILDKALSQIPALKEWLDHDWLRLAAIDPTPSESRLYRSSGWEALTFPESFTAPEGGSSRAIYQGKSNTIPVHILKKAPK